MLKIVPHFFEIRYALSLRFETKNKNIKKYCISFSNKHIEFGARRVKKHRPRTTFSIDNLFFDYFIKEYKE